MQREAGYGSLDVGMGVFPTGTGADVVDKAIEVCPQKGAGQGSEDRVSIFVHPSVLVSEGWAFHFEALGQTVHVGGQEPRARSFAASGTEHTVDFCESVMMEVEDFIFGLFGFESAEFFDFFCNGLGV
jgi:hypothetical protein